MLTFTVYVSLHPNVASERIYLSKHIKIDTRKHPVPIFTLGSEQLKLVKKFVYLDSCVSPGGGASDEINSRMIKARAFYANLGHLCCLHNANICRRSNLQYVGESSLVLRL